MSAAYDPVPSLKIGKTATQQTLSPSTGKVVVTRSYLSDEQVEESISAAHEAFKSWRSVPFNVRKSIVTKTIDEIVRDSDELSREITVQMGRPTRFAKGEMAGFEERARWLIENAAKALADEAVDEGRPSGIKRVIRRAPLGVCLLVGAWNFPYLIQVNALIPALLAGNSVLLKPSPQTPVCAERIAEALQRAGLPEGVCTVLHLKPAQMDAVVAHPLVPFISFTGSVANGKHVDAVAATASATNIGSKTVNLELGGKDAAYVRHDADLAAAVDGIVDGALFNSGQSCCAVERVYVHEDVYDSFVDKVVETVKGYKLGDPESAETTLGPVVSLQAASRIREHVKEAILAGAQTLIASNHYLEDKDGTPFVAPAVLVDVTHDMRVMKEETFGPVIPIVRVHSDEEAVAMINDSDFGLTCSVWTQSEEAFADLVDKIDAGTVFCNRADYLDPALCWTGVKDSGRGVSLSRYGFDAVTRPKSIHVKSLAPSQ